MIFPIDKTLSKIFDEAEEEFEDLGITRDQIKEAFYQYWYNARQIMRSYMFPTIVFPKWGRFIPKVTKIKALQKSLQNKDKVEDAKIVDEAITRLTNEKQKRKRCLLKEMN